MAEKDRSISPFDELDLPETTYSRDINNKVFQGVIERVISTISGVSLQGETLLDHMIGRSEKFRGITITQDPGSQTVKIRVELTVAYGINIPKKAEEIQSAIVRDVTTMTGLHVSEVHVLFKELQETAPSTDRKPPDVAASTMQEEFEDDF